VRTTPFQVRENDVDIPTYQYVTQVDEHNTLITINQGPITRSRAKKLHQEVNSLLAEINFNISENVILPKCSTLVVLRYIFERGGAAIHREEAKKKKQVDQFGQGGSSKFSSDKFRQISSENQFGHVRDFSSWWLFTSHNSRNSKVHSHAARRVVPCINNLCVSEIIKTFYNEIEPLLFSSVLTRSESNSLPLCSCDLLVGLHRRPLHQHPIRALGTLCSGCVGWFFESVIGRILDSGCRIETVVGSRACRRVTLPIRLVAAIYLG
jgi:hypothetical protein